MLKVYCAYDEMVDIAKLVPNPRNPNQHSDRQIELLAKIIEHQGWRVPITVSKRSGFVVRGHGRLLAAKALGLDKVPVDYQDYASEAEEWADLIADNRIAELSQMDNALLKDLLEEIDTGEIDLTLTGFDEEEIKNLMTQYFPEDESDVKEDDFDPDEVAEEIKEPITKSGDLWRLGRHFLLVGDSTKIEDVKRLMGNEKADMIFTDPPYNADYEGATGMKIKNDNMEGSEFYQFLYDAFVAMYQVTKEGGPIYVCHADSEGLNFRRAFQDAGFLLKQCLIWVKNSLVLGQRDYHWKHEPILYGWKPGAAHKWYGGRKETSVIEEPVDLAITPRGDHVLLTFNNGVSSTVVKVPSYEIVHDGTDEGFTTWRIERPQRNADHPTMKPISLCARAIRNSSKPNDRVLDPFGGSGSTLIACEQTGRICHTMEYDPVYAEVIIRRWEGFTGQKAELIRR